MLNLALGATSVLSVGDAMAMFKDWNDHEQPHTSVFGSQLWFVWTVGGAGAYVFAAAAIGFIGIQSRACICLALNVSMTMLILVLELLFVVLQLLDPTWEESFLPDDPTGQLQKVSVDAQLCNLCACADSLWHAIPS